MSRSNKSCIKKVQKGNIIISLFPHYFILLLNASTENFKVKNPGDDNGTTPLHLAAEFGICSIASTENFKVKNPGVDNGTTPLYHFILLLNLATWISS